ncbi:DnaJ domain-containing protein [Mucilaginibacter robiniae]|uniref:DnaJ domain-containing protein n=1 Tax=Mucilaginibacter robiniae TaxID=2728022 RepID=A0A7L5DX67_9SPHI|nr:DnaJ domain-containing protein [Mucilaginibacter robiniae]QJD94589.1 DnaJ domain-containing protein [Mucilaginibacter robiniae]
MKDFYSILGADAKSTSVEISEAYGKLSAKFHPEINASDQYFEKRFQEIHEAYEILSDPAKRRQYDRRYKQQLKRLRTKRIDVIFTIVLVLFTFIFGHYVIKSISKSKPGPPTQLAAVTVNSAPVHTVKHHKKRKHRLRIQADNSSWQANINKTTANTKHNQAPPTAIISKVTTTASNHPVITAPATTTPITTKKIPVENYTDTKAAHNNTPIEHQSNYLYTTDIVGNETGVVNMRKYDYYSSAVIKVIPSHAKVFVLAKGDNYYKIQFESTTGYVPAWTVQTH